MSPASDLGPVPKISIGVPVYNGADTIARALDSLLAQEFTDFELIISDNASTDGTLEIVRAYSATDQRIRLIEQPVNRGALANFAFVLNAAVGEYFVWAASDDIRSSDYLRVNYDFLVSHPEYVASTSPTVFDEQLLAPLVDGGGILGAADLGARIISFLAIVHDNSCFYALIRRELLKAAMSPIAWYLGFDWTIILRVVSAGPIALLDQGSVVRGSRGMSSNPSYIMTSSRVRKINWIFPFFDFSLAALRCARRTSWRDRLTIAYLLLRWNYRAFRAQLSLGLSNWRSLSRTVSI